MLTENLGQILKVHVRSSKPFILGGNFKILFGQILIENFGTRVILMGETLIFSRLSQHIFFSFFLNLKLNFLLCQTQKTN